MPSILTLTGSGESGQGLGKNGARCKCVVNTRTKRGALLCFVGKSKKSRSGWLFKGKCQPSR
jgi:hypothetical protein